MYKKLFLSLIVMTLAGVVSYVVYIQKSEEPKNIVIIPLDNRPVNMHFVKELVDIDGDNTYFPPVRILKEESDVSRIKHLQNWLNSIYNPSVVIISVDGMFFEGLTESREIKNLTKFNNPKLIDKYMNILNSFKEEHPKVPIYAFKTTPRLTTNVYAKDELSTYNYYYQENKKIGSAYFLNKPNQQITGYKTQLQQPLVVSESDYYEMRDFHVNFSKYLLKHYSNVFSEFLVTQDDAAETGIHQLDNSILKKYVADNHIQHVTFTNGADETTQVLIQRFLNKNKDTNIKVVYTSDSIKNKYIQYEETSVHNLIQEKSKVYHFNLVNDSSEADIILIVHLYDKDSTENLYSTLEKAKTYMDQYKEKNIAIADFSFGQKNYQLFNTLQSENLFKKNVSYVSWNTASNTLGISLSQMMIYTQSQYKNKDQENIEMLQYRILKDYAYKSNIKYELETEMEENHQNIYRDNSTLKYQKQVEDELYDFNQKLVKENPVFKRNQIIKNVSFPLNRLYEMDFYLKKNKYNIFLF